MGQRLTTPTLEFRILEFCLVQDFKSLAEFDLNSKEMPMLSSSINVSEIFVYR